VVTGGNSGIGEATARSLADMGMACVIAGRRADRNRAVAQALGETFGVAATPLEADVSKEEDCRRLIRETGERFGRLDVLVNNAGLGPRGTTIADSDTETFETVLRTNLHSAYWCSREAWPLLRRNEPDDASDVRGAILNVSSVCGIEAWSGAGLYAISKHGMMALTKAMSDEGKDARIRVSAICPAMVATPMTGAHGSEFIDPRDIAETARYLLSLRSAAWPTEIVVPRRGAG